MSWQAYVDNNMIGTGKVSRAAILGLQGGVWASSKNLTLTSEEQQAAINAFNNPDATMQSGLRFAGNKYFALSQDQGVIMLKKGQDGAMVAKTKQAVLVAVYEAPIQAQETRMIVEGLAEYLSNAGY